MDNFSIEKLNITTVSKTFQKTAEKKSFFQERNI